MKSNQQTSAKSPAPQPGDSGQIGISTLFIVAAVSPNSLVSLLCVLLYFFTVFPELKGLASDFFRSLLSRGNSQEEAEDPST